VNIWSEVPIEYESDVEERFGKEYESDVWYLSAKDKENYQKIFSKVDVNHDNVIDTNEANPFFEKSKLEKNVIEHIWKIIDSENKGYLIREQFYAMFHIIYKVAKNQFKPPETLPPCLQYPIIQQIGTTVTKRVKKTRLEKRPVHNVANSILTNKDLIWLNDSSNQRGDNTNEKEKQNETTKQLSANDGPRDIERTNS